MSPSTPPPPEAAGISRLTRLFHWQDPPSPDGADDCVTPKVDIRPRGSFTRRSESASLAGSFSSLNQKTPARSYFQRTYHGSLAPNEDALRSVREETAHLASFALSQPGSSPPYGSPVNGNYHHVSAPGTTARGRSRTFSPSRTPHDYLDKTSTGPARAVEEEACEPGTSEEGSSQTRHSSVTSALTEMMRASPPTIKQLTAENDFSDDGDEQFSSVTVGPGIISQPHERMSLFHGKSGKFMYGSPASPSSRDIESQETGSPAPSHTFYASFNELKGRVLQYVRTINPRQLWTQGLARPASYLPAVVLGLLLNILDALSYGMILFPLGQPVFDNLGSDGISMFYVSCIASQLVFSMGGSIFRGGVGSEMIEVVPFFHKMAFTIMTEIGDDKPNAVLATTILSYSISSIFTGVVFYIMGICKLGSLIGFFPRHILIGCIGGVGFFLVVTGVEVSARLGGNLEYNLDTLKRLGQMDTILLWTIPFGLAATLLTIKRWIKSSLTDAVFFISIIVLFYIVVAAVPNLSLQDLRSKGWVFEAPEAGKPWYHFYTLYDFAAVDWMALASTIPAMFALTFFGILHVPINVPALGLTTGEDNVDVDRELRAHGFSNALSGLCGSIQNYLVYTNTVLFMRSGGDSRVAGVLLAAATFGVLLIGPVTIGYIPIMVVGALIFFLGFDLMREALVDTIGRTSRLEYLTIIIIVVTMGIYDFVVGILTGIVLACVSYVLQTSQISAIRGGLTGGLASSTVRRHPTQRHFLQEVGRQIYVMKLAGYLFFGTIVGVEKRIRDLLRTESFDSQPIRFLVLDLSNVDGVDFSAAEAFTRINRILSAREVRMIMSGFSVDSKVGKSLLNVGLLDGDDGVEAFTALNSALEFCENDLLKAFYQRRDALFEHDHHEQPSSRLLDVPKPRPSSFAEETIFSSPRRGHLHEAATTTLQQQQDTASQQRWKRYKQPLQLMMQTFSTLSDKDEAFWTNGARFFERKQYSSGETLYRQGDRPDGFYLLETGILKANYKLPTSQSSKHGDQGSFSEVIVAGATCGELPFFSDTNRTSTTTAERDSVAWRLGPSKWRGMQKQEPDVAQELLKISLKLTSERMDVITKYMLLTGA